MATETVSTLATFGNGSELDYIEQDGQILFTAEEIGKHLGYANPAHAIHKLYRKNQNELKHYSTETKTVSIDEKQYVTRAFTEKYCLQDSIKKNIDTM